MDRSIPGEKIENLAIKVNINTSYNLGTSWHRVCVHTKQVSHKAQGKSPKLVSCLHDHSVFFCIKWCPCNTGYFFVLFFSRKCRWWRKEWSRIVKKKNTFWMQSNHCSWNHSEILNGEFIRLIHRSASMKWAMNMLTVKVSLLWKKRYSLVYTTTANWCVDQKHWCNILLLN